MFLGVGYDGYDPKLLEQMYGRPGSDLSRGRLGRTSRRGNFSQTRAYHGAMYRVPWKKRRRYISRRVGIRGPSRDVSRNRRMPRAVP